MWHRVSDGLVRFTVVSIQMEVYSIQTELVSSQKAKNQKEKNHVWLEVSELFELFVQINGDMFTWPNQ